MNWQQYTLDNETNVNEFALFIRDFTNELRCKKVLEVGCNVGHNLRELEKAHGIDIDITAIMKANNFYPKNNFWEDNILTTNIDWHTYDFVFTRAVLSHLNNDQVLTAMKKMFVASNSYIMTCEYYAQSYNEIPWRDEVLYCRNYAELWKKFDVKVILDTWVWNDPMKLRMCLVRII